MLGLHAPATGTGRPSSYVPVYLAQETQQVVSDFTLRSKYWILVGLNQFTFPSLLINSIYPS